MREHPIPQDVVGYRFHIIGNMTLKQFVEVGAGCVLGFLIYTTNLYAIIKWPLICLAVGAGAMVAFVPFEERPLDHWVITFFKVLYRPTKFFWKREPKVPEAFLFTASETTQTVTEVDLTPARRQRIKEYLHSVQAPQQLSPWDEAERVHINSILSSFETVRVNHIETNKQNIKPELKVRVRTMTNPQGPQEPSVPVFTIDEINPTPASPYSGQDAVFTDRTMMDVTQVAQEIVIPEVPQILVEEVAFEGAAAESGGALTPSTPSPYMADTLPIATTPTQAAVTNTHLPFPAPPTESNKVVGMVLTPANDLVPDAIVEVQTQDGRVARAVKTNALGQFFITTPLENGNYTFVVEKDNYTFAPFSLEVSGTVISPLEIRSLA